MTINLDKKCLDKVVTFEYIEKGKNGSIKSKKIVGKIVPQKNKTKKNNKVVYIYEALGNNKFSKRKKKYQANIKRKYILKDS